MAQSRNYDGICLEGLKKNRKPSDRITDNPREIRQSHLSKQSQAASNRSVFGSERETYI